MYRPMRQEIISVLVQNRANVLTRVISLYGRRGFNIDSLTVSPTNNPDLSRITIAFTAIEKSMQQIITQTEKLEVVESVMLMDKDNSFYRELLLLRVSTPNGDRTRVKEIVDIYRAKIVALHKESMIIELTGTPEKLNAFLKMLEDFDVTEVCRTGVTGIEKSEKGECEDD